VARRTKSSAFAAVSSAPPARLLDAEVRLGDVEGRVVHRRLPVRLAGPQFLPGGERGVHRVREPEHQARPEPGHERVPVLRDDPPLEVLLRAGVQEVIRPDDDVRHPQQPGPVVPGGRGLDLLARDLHVERAGVGEPEGGRQVHRQRGVRGVGRG
jgi:hypothetical protein